MLHLNQSELTIKNIFLSGGVNKTPRIVIALLLVMVKVARKRLNSVWVITLKKEWMVTSYPVYWSIGVMMATTKGTNIINSTSVGSFLVSNILKHCIFRSEFAVRVCAVCGVQYISVYIPISHTLLALPAPEDWWQSCIICIDYYCLWISEGQTKQIPGEPRDAVVMGTSLCCRAA